MSTGHVTGQPPSEYWDYDYPDAAERRHPAHPDYLPGQPPAALPPAVTP